MRFFKIKVTGGKWKPDSTNEAKPKQKKTEDFDSLLEEYAKEVQLADETYLEESFGQDFYINFSVIDRKKALVIMATERNAESMNDIKCHFSEYLARHNYNGKIEKLDEITGKTYRSMLNYSDRNDFIEDYDDTMERYGMKEINGRYSGGFSFEEFLLDGEKPTQEEAMQRVSELAVLPSLQEEVERIYKTTRKVWKPGNPTHYVLAADDGEDKLAFFTLLLKALYSTGRIGSRRFTNVKYDHICSNFSTRRLNEIYRLQTGGVVAVFIEKDQSADDDDDFSFEDSRSRAKEVCEMAMKWKNQVVTVFLFPRNSEKMQEQFFSEMDGFALTRIEEGLLFDTDAKAFLRKLAAENKLRVLKGLLATVEKKTGYTRRDLRKMFERWYDSYLKERVFPQYAESAIVMSKVEQGPKGRGIDELESLIGLAETKAVVSDILNFAKAQKLYLSDGKRKKQALRMVFTGNPGTAKTTVARLIAQILKENEVLKEGKLIEVGRSDLVGRYVGWTAPIVKGFFKQATGSVLFIDEAYSLVDDRDGLYGDEAITTIVQEMENRRDEVVVIFAGYPDKMEGFLRKNPGLRSRIGFHVNFPDYSTDELFEIMELLARNDEILLAEDVRERVFPMIEKAAKIREFGNGRYVRNLLEKAQMRQATRLVGMDQSKVTEQVASTLIADDFREINLGAVVAQEKRVGFI